MSETLTLPPAIANLLRQLAGSAIISAAIQAAGIGLAFLTFVAISRATTPVAYGIFAAGFSLATIAGFAATLGQHNAILRFWPAAEEVHGAAVAALVLRRCFLLLAAGTTITIILLIGAHLAGLGETFFRTSEPVLVWAGILAAAFALSEFSVSALRAQNRLVLALAPREIAWRVLVILALAVLVTPVAADLALAVVATALCLTLIPQLACLLQSTQKQPPAQIPGEQAREMKTAVPGLWGEAVIGALTAHTATIVVAFTLGPTAAGAFFAAERLARLLGIGMMGATRIAGPLMARSYAGGRNHEVRILTLAIGTGAFLIAAIGLLAYTVVGTHLLSLFDPTYSGAQHVLLILGAGRALQMACGPIGQVMLMVGRDRAFLGIMTGWALAGIPGLFWASGTFGLVGAAVASASMLIGINLSACVVSSLASKASSFRLIGPLSEGVENNAS